MDLSPSPDHSNPQPGALGTDAPYPQSILPRSTGMLSARSSAVLKELVRVLASPKPGDLTAPLMEVTLSDGTRLAAFADGSAGALPKNAR